MVKSDFSKTPTNEYQEEIKMIWKAFETLPDPEIPVLSILDLGMVRSIEWNEQDQRVVVSITPTYSGCPAVDAITTSIRLKLMEIGFTKFEIQKKLSPAWTTDWISDSGKIKMQKFGIAPPQTKLGLNPNIDPIDSISVACPRCDSEDTTLISAFGSTACKALFQCKSCLEPFDYFKCH